MAGYYDYVLAAIPVALLGVGGVLFSVGVSTVVAVVVASSVSLGIIGHAMFVRSPVVASTDDTVPDASGRPVADDAGSQSPTPVGD